VVSTVATLKQLPPIVELELTLILLPGQFLPYPGLE
jgi:hypothetical protein